MNTVQLATNGADAAASQAIEAHHAEMVGALAVRVAALVDAVARSDEAMVRDTRRALGTWCREELVPHAQAEEASLYPPAHEQEPARLLATAMIEEHRTIVDLVARVEAADRPVDAAAAATALQVLFEGHAAKENDLLLPVLAASRDVSLAELLEQMHGELTAAQPASTDDAPHGDGHACGCHEVDGDGYPELDARAVPHAIRHATIFGALDAVAPGGGMVLVAPHDPLPLLAQVEDRAPGAFEVTYLQRGPEAWRLQFVRRSAA